MSEQKSSNERTMRWDVAGIGIVAGSFALSAATFLNMFIQERNERTEVMVAYPAIAKQLIDDDILASQLHVDTDADHYMFLAHVGKDQFVCEGDYYYDGDLIIKIGKITCEGTLPDTQSETAKI